jgi:hypothetical protein
LFELGLDSSVSAENECMIQNHEFEITSAQKAFCSKEVSKFEGTECYLHKVVEV